MNSLEIIHLRSSGEPIETLAERIRSSLDSSNGEPEVFTMYRRHGLETDVAVHIRHAEDRSWNGPSDLALRLAYALRVYGIVEHTSWEEIG
jgi:hypothetical protein